MLNIDLLYASCAAPEVHAHPAENTHLRRLTRAIKETDRIARAEGVEQQVHRTLARTRAIRFALIASPISGNDDSLRLESLAQRLASAAQELRMTVSAEVVAAFSKLPPLVSAIAQETESPLGETLLNLLRARKRESKTCAIVLPQPSLKSAAELWIQRFTDKSVSVQVLTPSMLRGAEYFDELFIFGAPRWYLRSSGDFLFATPRAKKVHILGYSWTDLSLRLEPLFRTAPAPVAGGPGAVGDAASSPAPNRVVVPPTPIESIGEEQAGPEDEDDPTNDILIDVQAMLNRRRANQIPDPDHEEEVEARIALLAGGEAVLLPWTDDAKTFCANFDRKLSARSATEDDEEAGTIRRQLNQELQAGDFIILRTGSAGDILPQVADSIMGPLFAKAQRKQQKEWKMALRKAAGKVGTEDLCVLLRKAGATHASQTNLRNWMRERTIRPDSDEDFHAILQVCELEARHEAFFETANLLNTMHRKAGFRIRKLLIAEVNRADLSELASKGRMTFMLKDVSDEASMTAYRIERILPDPLVARLHEVNDVFVREEELWQ